MKVIKKINNNIAIAVDGENNEVIVFAKGIGYGNIPYEIKDLSVIERTFYDVDNRYYGLDVYKRQLNQLLQQIFCNRVNMQYM